MTTDHAVAFLLFAVVAAVTPGPSNVILAAVGANAGIAKGLPSLLGVAAGVGTMMFIVPLGVGSVVLASPIALAALRIGGAMFLLWLAGTIAMSRPVEATPERSPVGFLGAAAFQWVNPKIWLVTISAAGTYLDPDAASPVAQAAWLAGLFVLAALPSCFVWLAFGATVQRLLRSPRSLRAFNVAMGALLAVSVAMILR